MIIIGALQQRKNAPPGWMENIKTSAGRLEGSLYRSAQSRAAYQDKSTLNQRLRLLHIRNWQQSGPHLKLRRVVLHRVTQLLITWALQQVGLDRAFMTGIRQRAHYYEQYLYRTAASEEKYTETKKLDINIVNSMYKQWKEQLENATTVQFVKKQT